MATRIRHITIVGAGLAGCLLALMLARRGYTITLFDRAGDPRHEAKQAQRSINLALSARGCHALDTIGLKARVLRHAVPIQGRCLHRIDEPLHYQTYGVNDTHVVYAVQRETLHRVLVDACAAVKAIQLHFSHQVTDWDPTSGELALMDANGVKQTHSSELVIGADGAHSLIRKQMIAHGGVTFKEDVMSHGYKELTIPKVAAKALDAHWLHIWPRESFMFIALPNEDSSFTGTLFMANQGTPSFETLTTPSAVQAFFNEYLPSLLTLIPNLVNDFLARPLGHIPHVQGFPWHLKTRACLIGDAAHAVMPFYGQGMNCAFEDCEVLADLIDVHKKNWDRAFHSFERARKPNTDAIAALSMENYRQMRDHVTDATYQQRLDVEHALMQRYPRLFMNRYAMVSFALYPYAFIQACGALQQKLIDGLLTEIDSAADLEHIPHLEDRVRAYARAVMKLKMTFM